MGPELCDQRAKRVGALGLVQSRWDVDTPIKYSRCLSLENVDAPIRCRADWNEKDSGAPVRCRADKREEDVGSPVWHRVDQISAL